MRESRNGDVSVSSEAVEPSDWVDVDWRTDEEDIDGGHDTDGSFEGTSYELLAARTGDEETGAGALEGDEPQEEEEETVVDKPPHLFETSEEHEEERVEIWQEGVADLGSEACEGERRSFAESFEEDVPLEFELARLDEILDELLSMNEAPRASRTAFISPPPVNLSRRPLPRTPDGSIRPLSIPPSDYTRRRKLFSFEPTPPLRSRSALTPTARDTAFDPTSGTSWHASNDVESSKMEGSARTLASGGQENAPFREEC